MIHGAENGGEMKVIPAIFLCFLLLYVPMSYPADKVDVPFRVCLLAHHALALGDYWTTYHASFDSRYHENNWLTRQYWRSPPAFSAFKAVEVVVLDSVFKWVYRKSKFLGYGVVIGFALVRYLAIRDNMQVLHAAGR